eukprot:SAG11_NODE_416_length_9669_cov_7.135528_5_plen_89_part_00
MMTFIVRLHRPLANPGYDLTALPRPCYVRPSYDAVWAELAMLRIICLLTLQCLLHDHYHGMAGRGFRRTRTASTRFSGLVVHSGLSRT